MSPALRDVMPQWFHSFRAGANTEERTAQKLWNKAASGEKVDEKALRAAMQTLGKSVDDLANALADREQRRQWRELVDQIPRLEQEQSASISKAVKMRAELEQHIKQTEIEIGSLNSASGDLAEQIRLARVAAAKLREGRPNPRLHELVERMHTAREQLRMHKAAVEQAAAAFEADRESRARNRANQTGAGNMVSDLIMEDRKRLAAKAAERLELSQRMNKARVKDLEKEIADAAKELAEIERVQLEP